MQARETELAQEAGRVPLEVPHERARVEAHAWCPHQPFAEADEGEDERDLERVGEVVGELEGQVVQPEDETGGQAQEGGHAHDREEAEH